MLSKFKRQIFIWTSNTARASGPQHSLIKDQLATVEISIGNRMGAMVLVPNVGGWVDHVIWHHLKACRSPSRSCKLVSELRSDVNLEARDDTPEVPNPHLSGLTENTDPSCWCNTGNGESEPMPHCTPYRH
jgi:hypothetical protein